MEVTVGMIEINVIMMVTTETMSIIILQRKHMRLDHKLNSKREEYSNLAECSLYRIETTSRGPQNENANRGFIFTGQPSPLDTEALCESLSVTISGEGYMTNADIRVPGARRLVFDDVLFSWEVNEEGNTR
jgi:hypothetical protein